MKKNQILDIKLPSTMLAKYGLEDKSYSCQVCGDWFLHNGGWDLSELYGEGLEGTGRTIMTSSEGDALRVPVFASLSVLKQLKGRGLKEQARSAAEYEFIKRLSNVEAFKALGVDLHA